MNLENLALDEARRYAALHGQFNQHDALGISRVMEMLSPWQYLHETLEPISDRLAPSVSLAETLFYDPTRDANAAIVETMWKADSLNAAADGIADIVRRSNPLADIQATLAIPQPADPLRGVVDMAARLEQPILDLHHQLSRETMPDVSYGDLDAFREAVNGISEVLRRAAPLFDLSPAQFAASVADEYSNYQDEATEFFESAFGADLGVLDAATFQRGVARIVQWLSETKPESLRSQFLSAFLANLLAGVIVMFLGMAFAHLTKIQPCSCPTGRIDAAQTPMPSPSPTASPATGAVAESP